MNRISVAQPFLGGNEKKYVQECLDTNWISSIGRFIDLFETEFAKFCGVKHAISTNNGTTALHVALVALGLQPGDEVLIPTVTYIATANAVTYCGAKPILVDVEPGTLNIDPNQIRTKITNKTVGIIPVHLYGHPADMVSVNAIAKEFDLWVLEDAAEAHGAEVEGIRTGNLADCAVFSFFGNKIITTGEGGMVTTNSDELASKIRLLKGQGMDPRRRYWFPVVGYNYRMTNIEAAIGLAQLENIEEALAYRKKLAGWYDEALGDIDGILLPKSKDYATHSYWMYTIFFNRFSIEQRDRAIHLMSSMGIETRPVFYPMHALPPYSKSERFPVADKFSQIGVNLPTHQSVSKSNVLFIADALREVMAAT